ncbi:MAG: DUF819 family protein [Pseudomonadota bacterium]
MITDTASLLITLVAVLVGVYLVSMLRPLRGFFHYFPPVIWLYFVPMFLSTAGVVPAEHPLYSTMAKFLLPIALILLTLSTDLKAISSVGPQALLALAAGALGVSLGCLIVFVLLQSSLPDNAWQGLSLLSATWIGGSANLVAMQQSLNADPVLVGFIVVVDSIIAYSWLGLVVALSAQQRRINRWLKADDAILERVEGALRASEGQTRSVTTLSLSIMLGGALIIAYLARQVGEALPAIGSPPIITATTWAILITVTLGLLLSGSSVGRAAREYRAAEYAYASMFLLFTSVGAQADLRAVTEAPVFLVAGILVMAIHVSILLGVCRWLRLPAFFFAVGSTANIGGATSASITATAFRPSLTTVGALLGIAGYIVGVYLPIGIASLLAALAS